MNPIKFIDLKPIGKLAGQLNVAYDRVFNSGQYIGGKEVEAFEAEWAEYCGVKYCMGVGNGHDALSLACKYFSEPNFPIKPYAFTSWKTCLPTWTAIRNGNMIPNLDFDEIENIVIAVHIYGQIQIPYHIYNSIIIEDCAQAHGAKSKGLKAGQFGQVAAWSFYPTKNLGALGDGGAVTTNNQEIAEFVKERKNYGSRDNCGINSRLDPLQAAFLRVKLKYLDEWNAQRYENAICYLNNINREKINLPSLKTTDQPCWHIFAIEVKNRDGLRDFLLQHNVETMVHYPKPPYPSEWHISEAEDWANSTLSLPVAPHVTPHICKQISDLINEWADK